MRLMNGNYLPTGVKKEKKFTFDQAISVYSSDRDRVYFRFKVISCLTNQGMKLIRCTPLNSI